MGMKIFEASFLKFLVVGGIGFILNLTLFYIMADLLTIESNLAAIIAFIVCVTHNYLLNHIWSFKKMVNTPPNFTRYAKFFLVCCCGLIVNLLVLNFILIQFKPDLKVLAEFFAVISSTIINFLGSRFLVFFPDILKKNTTQMT